MIIYIVRALIAMGCLFALGYSIGDISAMRTWHDLLIPVPASLIAAAVIAWMIRDTLLDLADAHRPEGEK